MESRSRENGHITLEAVDGCSAWRRDAAGSLDALHVVVLLSVLCKSILRIDLHTLHVVSDAGGPHLGIFRPFARFG